MDKVVIFVTVSNEDEGKKIAQAVVEEKLAACANLFPNIYSIYWWQNKIQKSSEYFIMIKTKNSLIDDLTARIKQLHSYIVPEIVALPIISGNTDYLQWIENVVLKKDNL